MIITNFDSFNEGFLGIDLKKIKEEAQNFAKKKRYEITNCHNKSDHSARLPEKFINIEREARSYGYYSTKSFIKPEYVKVNLAKAALKFDKTFNKALSDQIVRPIRATLNKPGIAKFIDFYDSDD